MAQGDWLVRHCPGTQLAADLGTKVLSADRFEYLKTLLGMKKIEENQKKEDGSERSSQGALEAKRKILKAIILMAQIAQVQGTGVVLREPEVIEVRSTPFTLIGALAVAFVIGTLIGSLLFACWVMTWTREVESVVRPASLEEAERILNRDRASRNQLRERVPQSAASTQVIAPLPVSSTLPTSSPTASALHVTAGGGSEQAAARSAAGSAAAPAAAPNPFSSAVQSSSAVPSSAAAAAGSAIASEGGGLISQTGTRRRRDPDQAVPANYSWYVSDAGERYHRIRTCHGLRKARFIRELSCCPDCIPANFRFEQHLYAQEGVTDGDMLHVKGGQGVDCRNDLTRRFLPCWVCV